MSLRDKLILKDNRARPPQLLRKVCCHNGTTDLAVRFRGDMGFDLDFELMRQVEIYTCIQCGHVISATTMMVLYQRYMLTGEPIVVGRNVQVA